MARVRKPRTDEFSISYDCIEGDDGVWRLRVWDDDDLF